MKKATATKAGRAFNRVKTRRESTITMLKRLLLTPIPSKTKGKKSGVAPLEAIVTQLMRKALEGDARAVRALERYQQVAARSVGSGLEVEFAGRGAIGGATADMEGNGE